MSVAKSGWNLGRAMAIAGLVSLAAVATPASAATPLFVKVGPTSAPGPNRCLSFAADAARDVHLQNIKQPGNFVSGVLNDKSVFVVCVGSVAVISVAGGNAQEIEQLGEAIFKHISSIATP